jgi:hypothetical protein
MVGLFGLDGVRRLIAYQTLRRLSLFSPWLANFSPMFLVVYRRPVALKYGYLDALFLASDS